MPKISAPILVAACAALVVLISVLVGPGCDENGGGGNDAGQPDPAVKPVAARANPHAGYVGTDACIECHAEQHIDWQGSHHDLAMQLPNDETVLGDFNNSTFTHYGVTSTFFKKDGKFFVNTEGPDGKMQDYRISYAFGVTPLQQYLIAFPGGRYQVLGVCWDSRPADQGGQKWFHIYPDEHIPPGDILHWTRENQNWNYMCAECHSTDLKKNYDFATDTYKTTYAEINVGCEACHGPGEDHLEWAKNNEAGIEDARLDMGLAVRLKEPVEAGFILDEETGAYNRLQPLESDIQIETCARCHARRTPIANDYIHGKRFMDQHIARLLDEGLYHADGQILDEVYVYGSFVQSKMYHKDVRCSDCHDVHSLKLVATGNSLCLGCHQPEKYDVDEHLRHAVDTAGSQCVDCHMPQTTYMVIDPRRDHSIRVPRPDLSVTIGTPNACNGCHDDQDAQWAADYVDQWYGKKDRPPHFAEALHAAREGASDAPMRMLTLAMDTEQPAIARATAFKFLSNYRDQMVLQVANAALGEDEPMIREAALTTLEMLPATQRPLIAKDLLTDKVRAVRNEAARILAAVPPAQMPDEMKAPFKEALDEYIDSQLVNSDRHGSHMNIGVMYVARGEFEKAEQAYRDAMKVQPDAVQPYINLADLYRQTNREAEAEKVLRQAIEINPKDPNAHHALGLSLIRQKKTVKGIDSLKTAAELAPNEPRYSYVLAVAYNDQGQFNQAMLVLQKAAARHPNDRDLLMAMLTFSRDAGQIDLALRYGYKLLQREPNNQGLMQLIQQLEAAKQRRP